MAQNYQTSSGNYPRGTSGYSYVADSYFDQTPHNMSGQGYVPTRPRGPSLENRQIPSIPPTPQSYGLLPTSQSRGFQRQGSPSRPGQDLPYPSHDRVDSLRPPVESRRLSSDSRHSHESRRSHDSHRSNRSKASHQSQHSNRSRRSSYSHSPDDQDDRRRRRDAGIHDRRSKQRYSDDPGKDSIKQADTHRPTFGDTIYELFGFFKHSLSSSDRK